MFSLVENDLGIVSTYNRDQNFSRGKLAGVRPKNKTNYSQKCHFHDFSLLNLFYASQYRYDNPEKVICAYGTF